MRCFAIFCLASLPAVHAATATATNSPALIVPKAARTATLVYEIGEADLYYGEMIVQKTTDGSFFMACGWDDGVFGLQQYVGEEQRSVVFAVWNGGEQDEAAAKAAGPVQILDWNPGGKTNVYGGDKLGAQYMRQIHWRVGETNRFAIDAVRSGKMTTYSAWLDRAAAGNWEKIATVRGFSGGKWMRGYNSFVEDFRRDFKSPNETRRARLNNFWIHQFRGSWVPVSEAVFITSVSRYEAADKVDVGDEEGGFFMATGGDTVKHHKVGDHIWLPSVPLRTPVNPNLPFLVNDKPKP
jgi:hypothetical protein